MKKMRWIGLLAVVLFVGAGVAQATHGCPLTMFCFGLGKIPLFLLALAAGYWVMTLSDKQQKPLDILGRITGGLILVLALIGLIFQIMMGACDMKYKHGMGPGMKAGKAGCFGMKGMPPKSDIGE